MQLFFKRRASYIACKNLLTLPCEKTLRNYFGKFGTAGSVEECKTAVNTVFQKLEGQKLCFITADEVHIKPSIRYRANHIIGFAEDEEESCAAKTVLAVMINFFGGQPAFVARLLPVKSLDAEFLFPQLLWLIQIIHEAAACRKR